MRKSFSDIKVGERFAVSARQAQSGYLPYIKIDLMVIPMVGKINFAIEEDGTVGGWLWYEDEILVYTKD